MINKQKLSIFVLSIGLTLFGCQKPATTVVPSGNIFGTGFLYDQYGDRVFSNLGGDSIRVKNSGTSAVTNASGQYTLGTINEGIYSLSFSKTGYGNMQLNNAQFIGGGNTEHDFKLAAIPNYNVATIDSSNLTNLNNLVTWRIYGTLSSTDPLQREVLLLFGNGSAVSTNPANYVLNYTGKTILNPKTGAYSNVWSVSVPLNEIYNGGFTRGTNVTIAVTGVSGVGNTASIYEDPETGRTVYTAVSPGTPVLKTIMIP